MNERLLEKAEAAAYVGMDIKYLLNQAKTGNVPYVQPSPKKIMFTKTDLDRWIAGWKHVGSGQAAL